MIAYVILYSLQEQIDFGVLSASCFAGWLEYQWRALSVLPFCNDSQIDQSSLEKWKATVIHHSIKMLEKWNAVGSHVEESNLLQGNFPFALVQP
jgi:hypothetical protein